MKNEMSWNSGRGDGLGNDPYLIFPLSKSRHVYCVRIKFVLANVDHRECVLQSYWMETGRTSFADPRCTALYRIRPCAAEQVLTVWIGHQTAGVSLLSWSAYLISTVFWFWFGIQGRDKNIYLPCLGWITLDIGVIARAYTLP